MDKMRRFEKAMRGNMASAEKDMPSSEDRSGFLTGAILKLWKLYQDHQIDESQFDKLIDVLSGFSKGQYRDFIHKQVADYKGGKPPIIIGY